MDRGVWRASVHGVAKSWTWLRHEHFHFSCIQYINSTITLWVKIPLLSPLKYTMDAMDSVQFISFTQLCLTLWDPMNCFPVHHQLPELAQTQVHRVGDAIQPSHPLLSPSPPAFNHSQHQGLFQWVSSSHQVAKVSVLPMNIQDWFPLAWTCWISLQSKGLSRVFSNTTVEKHRFFGTHLTLQSNSHIHTWLLEKP